MSQPDPSELASSNADTNAKEAALLDALREMLGQSAFLYPLVAAQRQFRLHYYGLSAAALLEDLFFDALANYLRQYRPECNFERPGRGQKGWDYSFEGLKVSHKVGQKPQRIAVLWDATVANTTWTFDFPLVYLCSGYHPTVGSLHTAKLPIKALTGDPSERIAVGNRVWVVVWPPGAGEVLVWSEHMVAESTTVGELLPFGLVWKDVAACLQKGFPASSIEILRSGKKVKCEPLLEQQVPVDFTHRSGLYLIPSSELQNVPVEKNNRGLLLPESLVRKRMAGAEGSGSFVPFPLWFRLFAGNRPPDLYLAQRQAFDELFSSRGVTQ